MATVQERIDKGTPHDPRSVELYRSIMHVDFQNQDYFCFKSGGEGDNGDHLMYLLDIHFEQEDNKQK